LFQRDLRTADELFRQGSFFAAARLLKGYSQPEALRARDTALCLHEWQRMNYAKAASQAAKFSEELRTKHGRNRTQRTQRGRRHQTVAPACVSPLVCSCRSSERGQPRPRVSAKVLCALFALLWLNS